MRLINEIIIHHSLTKDGATVSWGAIRKYHTETRGWEDIGYHYGVELVGDHFETLVGRPLAKEGAHTLEHNANSIGICCVGNFNVDLPEKGLFEQLGRLVYDLQRVIPTIKKISFHRDYAPWKSCPGHNFPRLPWLISSS